MKNACVLLTILTFSGSALAASHSDAIGQFKVELKNVDDCPVQLSSAVVDDPERRPPVAVALLGAIHTNGKVYFHAGFKSKKTGAIAVEVEWTAINGMDETLASRKIVYTFKHPIEAGHEKSDYLEGDRLADDAAKYTASITRVKFQDGTFWPAALP